MLKPRDGDDDAEDDEAILSVEGEPDEAVSSQATARHQKYREAKKANVAKLKQKQAELESALARLRVDSKGNCITSALPWKSIAKALKDSRDEAHRQNRELRAKIHMYHRLVQQLDAWVGEPRDLNSTCQTWRDSTLLADPTSRRMGKEWIVQRMLHNTDEVFRQHGFPPWASNDTEFWRDMDITFTECGSLCTIRRNFIADQSFESTVAFVRANCLSTLLVQAPSDSVMREAEANTQLLTVVSNSGEFVHILCGEFHQGPDRCVFVLRQITQDDGRPRFDESVSHQRSRMLWYDYTREPNGRTRKRVLGLVTNCHYKTEFDINVEAALFGLDLAGCPDHLKESRFRNHIVSRWDRFMLSIEASLKNPL